MGKRVIDKRYEVLKKLGSGGMGEVYEVKDRTSGATLALKLTKKGISEDELLLFKKEFYTLASLRHPNIVKVHDFATLPNGRHYFTMDFVPGQPITKAFRGFDKSLYPALAQVLSALDYIHSKGLVHGDLKPENIVVAGVQRGTTKGNRSVLAQPVAKILDFGLVEHVSVLGPPAIRGTLGYIPPELLKGGRVDGRADLYSLGIVLHETLTQKRAFRGKTATDTLRANLEKALPSPRELHPEIPPKLEELVIRLVQKDPRDRYESTADVLRDLSRLTRTAGHKRVRSRVPQLFYSPIIGRETELSLLHDSLSKAEACKGQLVLITGETGIGKSRLLLEFKLMAQLAGHRVIWISCSAGHLVGQFYKQLGLSRPKSQTAEPGLSKLRTFNHLADSVIKYVRNAKTGVVFLLDDLDCADQIDWEFVGFLNRSLRSQPAAVVAALQPDVVSDTLITGVEDEPFLTRLFLTDFSEDQTRSLVLNLLNTEEQIDTLAEAIHRRVSGNPLLVEETLRSMLTQRILTRRGKRWRLKREALRGLKSSGTMEAIVGTRIKILNGQEATLLSTASVLGESFPLYLLRDLSGLREADLLNIVSSLQRKNLLRSEGDSLYRFSHKSVQDYLYRRLGTKTRKQLHHQAALRLEEEPPQRREELLPLLAYHYLEAGVRGKALQFGIRAAEKAEQSYAAEAALDHYRAALKLAPLQRRPELHEKIGDLQSALGFHKEALRDYRSALRGRHLSPQQEALLLFKMATIHRKAKQHTRAMDAIQNGLAMLKGDKTSLTADLLTEWGWVLMEEGDYGKAIECLGEAEEVSETVEDRRTLSDVYHARAVLHWQKGELEMAIKFTQKSLDLRRRPDDRKRRARSYNNLGVIYWTKGDMGRAGDSYERALREFEKLGDIGSIADTNLNLGLLNWTQCNWEASVKYYDRAYLLFDRLGDRAAVACVHNELGIVNELTGKWDKAREHYQADLEFKRRIGDEKGQAAALTNLGSLLLKLGDWRRSAEMLEESLRLNEKFRDEKGIALSLLNLAMLHRDRLEWPEALDHLSRCISIQEDRELARDLPTSYRVMSEVLAGSGDLMRAAAFASKALRLATKLNDKLEVAHTHRTLGVLGAKEGRRETATSHFEQAASAFEELIVPYELARTLLEFARWGLEGKRNLTSATLHLARADDLFGRLGAKADLERVHELESLFVRFCAQHGGPIVREAQLKALYEVSQLVSSILDTKALYDRVIDLVVSLLRAERGLLLLTDDHGELTVAAGRDMDSPSIEDATTLSKSVIAEVSSKGLPVISDDASLDPRFRERESVILNHIHSLLCVPLKLKETVTGALYVDSRIAAGLFSSDDLSFLDALANLLTIAIENAGLHDDLRQETDHLRREVKERYRLGSLVGKSDAMQAVFEQIRMVSNSDASVLIEGETGTGKELVARAIHYNGPRKDHRFIPVECGALPETLAESELFGYSRGAFTDAKRDKPGLFEEAERGTLFLDQIDDLSPRLQAKLLRALQDGEVRRLGETTPRKVDTRIIAATNRNLRDEVKRGRFRDDLYFRVNTFYMHIPPLRHRRDDIPLLAAHFLSRFSSRTNRRLKRFDSRTIKCLMAYSWPGNVRELEHEIERAATLAIDGYPIGADSFSDEIVEAGGFPRSVPIEMTQSLKAVMGDIERHLILAALNEHGWNQTRTARALGISRPSLIEKMSRHRIRRPRP